MVLDSWAVRMVMVGDRWCWETGGAGRGRRRPESTHQASGGSAASPVPVRVCCPHVANSEYRSFVSLRASLSSLSDRSRGPKNTLTTKCNSVNKCQGFPAISWLREAEHLGRGRWWADGMDLATYPDNVLR